MNPCPKCGANDWKKVTEQRQHAYSACGNCHYAPALEQAVTVDARDWVLQVAREHDLLAKDALQVEQRFHEINRPTTLHHGLLNRAKRLLADSDKKMLVAEAVSSVVEATENGQITLIIPELGLFQFEWGDFDLFKGIDQVQAATQP